MTDLVLPAQRFKVAVQAIRAASTAGAMTLLVGFGAVNVITTPQPSAPAEQIGMQSGPLDDMMQRNRCSFTGFDRDVIPSKAIMRTPEGETELVSFDHGWAVFSGDVAGELVAVCLGAPTTTATG
jgi:hypothetical protein